MKLQGYAPLLARCPNLLVLSTNGAGFDTVSLSDATAAGVAVVNQAGGNKEGVAEHVMAMMLTLSKRLVMSDHAMRSGAAYDRRDFMGDDVQGRTIGIIGLGHVGSRVAELCRGLFQMRVIAFDPYLTARGDCGQGGGEGCNARRYVAGGGLRIHQLSAYRGDPGDDGGGAVRIDAAACVFHYDGAGWYPRRRRAGRGVDREGRSRAQGWMCGRMNRRRPTIRCCGSTMLWSVRTPRGSRGSRDTISRRSPLNRCWIFWMGRSRRAC